MNPESYGVVALDERAQRTLDGGLPGTGCPACDGPQFPPIRNPTWPWPTLLQAEA